MKFFDKIYIPTFPTDKLAHFVVMFMVAFLILMFLKNNENLHWLIMPISLFIGICKELFDAYLGKHVEKFKGKKFFDWMDVIATFAGGCMAFMFDFIIINLF